MKTNYIVTAPQVFNLKEAYSNWKETHLGSFDDFCTMLLTPSADRDVFLATLSSSASFLGSIAVTSFNRHANTRAL